MKRGGMKVGGQIPGMKDFFLLRFESISKVISGLIGMLMMMMMIGGRKALYMCTHIGTGSDQLSQIALV